MNIQLNNGQKLSIGVAVYIVIKQIVNSIIGGFGGLNFMILLAGIAAGVCFYQGVKKSNIVVAVLMMLVACAYLPGNIKNFQLLYLIEGVVDILGALLLAFHPDIRTHCKMSK
ncbi:MAG: hypothetical protein MJ065_03395 [Oscillospiraceae bacterium]|nr:hypothetical protein [Oscillospiraceae bacterium]